MTDRERRLGWGAALLGAALLLGCGAPASDPSTPQSSPRPDAAADADTPLHERVRRIADGSDGIERARALTTLLQASGPEDLDEIRRGLATSQRVRGDVELALFAEWWAGFDPLEAFKWTQFEYRADHPRVVSAVIRTWARRSPEEAMSLGHLGPRMASGFGSEINHAAIVGWYESGEPGLFDWILSINANDTQQKALATYVSMRVLDDGPRGALAWADAESSGQEALRRWLFQRVLSTTAEFDAETSVAMLEELRGRGEEMNDYAERIGARWAKWDPEAMMAWAATLEDADERREVVERGYATWLRRKPEEAIAWLEVQEVEPWLEPAVPQYLQRTVGREAPDVEWEAVLDRWLGAVTAPDTRRRAAMTVLRFWVAHDPDGAVAWMDARPGLPEVVRSKTLEFKDTEQAGRLRAAGLKRQGQPDAGQPEAGS